MQHSEEDLDWCCPLPPILLCWQGGGPFSIDCNRIWFEGPLLDI